jgi:hypothetical protein
MWGMVCTMLLLVAGCAAGHSRVAHDGAAASFWRMTNGEVELTVDLAKNRISSYQFVGGRNVLWVNPSPEDVPADSTPGPNWGGDRVWVWPQRYWNWPPPLPTGGYQARSVGDRKIILTSGPVLPWGVRVVREIELAPVGTEVTITTCLEQIAAATPATDTRPIAPWSVTQVPLPNRLLAHVPRDTDRQAVSLGANGGFAATAHDDAFVELRRQQAGGIKTFLDADVLRAEYDDVVFSQRQTPVHREGTWALAERCQLYLHSDDSFVELEWTSPMLPPQRVGQSPLCVVWSLHRR